MKSHVVVSKVLGLLAVLAVLACGGTDDPPSPTPPRVPGAPSGVTATPGDARATVSWTAPADNGGSDIVEYVVRASRNGATEKTQRSPTPSLTVTELVNGESYSFTVTALNAVGESLPSAASATVVPRVIPGAPRNVSATPGDQQITVTWEPPTDNGMAITGYTVTVHEGDKQVASQQASGLSATVSNLVNGTAYLVTVSASNSVVPGPTSDPVAVTPRTVPGAPTLSSNYHLHQGTTVLIPVILSWTAPETGGSPITRYVVTVKVGDTVVHTEETTETMVTFTKLTNGTTLTASVVAHNVAGASVPSTPHTRRLCGYPSVPRSVLTESGDGQVTLSWRAPAELSGCPILRYRISVNANDVGYKEVFTETLSGTVTGLTNGNVYEFSVDSINAETYGDPARAATRPYTTPLAPPNFQATPEDGAVVLTWSQPDFRGSNPNGYTVTVTPGDLPPFNLDSTEMTLQVSELKNDTPYTFTVFARSNAGDGATSTTEATPRAP
jgi:hypothetical protein